MFKQYKDIGEVFGRYWTIYGRFDAVKKSPYLHVSVVITLLLYNTWSNHDWWDTVISVIPSLIGFTLGGYAIIVTLGNDEFKDYIYSVEDGDRASFILDIGATFVNFIMLQILSLLIALVAKGLYVDISSKSDQLFSRINLDIYIINTIFRYVFWFVGELIFIYAVITTIAAAMAIFRLNSLYQEYVNIKNKVPLQSCPHCAELINQDAKVCRYCGRDL